MRISQSMLTRMVATQNRDAQQRLVEATTKLAAPSAVMSPIDDPAAAERVMRMRHAEGELSAMGDRRDAVRRDLEGADVALDGIHEHLIDAYELALSMSNDDASASERGIAAAEARGLFDRVVGLANRQMSDGKHLFTGLQEQTPAFDDRGAYQGDAETRFVEIGPGYRIAATLTGAEAFGANDEVMSALGDFVTALEANDGAGIRDAIDTLSAARDVVGDARSKVGARLALIEDVAGISDQLRVNLELQRGAVEAVDFARGASELAAAQSALQTVVEVSRGLLTLASGSWLK